jgi:hypothetical protein
VKNFSFREAVPSPGAIGGKSFQFCAFCKPPSINMSNYPLRGKKSRKKSSASWGKKKKEKNKQLEACQDWQGKKGHLQQWVLISSTNIGEDVAK